MKLKQYLALITQFRAIKDAATREAAMKTLVGIKVTDDDGNPVTVELVDLNVEGAAVTESETDEDVEGDDEATKTAKAARRAAKAAAAGTGTAAPAGQRATTPTPGAAGTTTVIETEDDRTARIVRTVLAQTTASAGATVPARQLAAVTRQTTNIVSGGNTGEKFIVPAGIKLHRVKNFKGVINGKSPEERAFRFGMWALAAMTRSMPGRYQFKSAVEFVEQQKLHRGGDNGAGGYLVPEEFGTDLIDLREQFGVVRRLFKNVKMTGETRTDPRRKSGLTAYFVADGASGTESTKGWDEVRLVAKELMVLSRYTANLDADAVISIGDDLASEIAYAYSEKEDDCGLNGTGASTYGGIVGVRTALAAATASLVTGAGSTWSALTLANFQSVVGLLPQYADNGASWVAHKSFYAGVMQRLELAAGGVTSMEIAAGDRRPRPMFLGYPVDFSQKMPSATASAQIPCTLGDYTKAATFGDRQVEEISFSEHATIGGESLWEKKQIGIRGTERFDISVHDVGDTTTPGPVVGLITT